MSRSAWFACVALFPGLALGAAQPAPAQSILGPEVICSLLPSRTAAQAAAPAALTAQPDDPAPPVAPPPQEPVLPAVIVHRDAVLQQPHDGRELVDQVVAEQMQEERLVEPPVRGGPPQRHHHRWRLPAMFVIPTPMGG